MTELVICLLVADIAAAVILFFWIKRWGGGLLRQVALTRDNAWSANRRVLELLDKLLYDPAEIRLFSTAYVLENREPGMLLRILEALKARDVQKPPVRARRKRSRTTPANASGA